MFEHPERALGETPSNVHAAASRFVAVNAVRDSSLLIRLRQGNRTRAD